MMGPHMPELEDIYVRDDAKVSRMAREVLARDELEVLELINGRNSSRTSPGALARAPSRSRGSSIDSASPTLSVAG